MHFQGFTKMSSGLLADELVDLVNAIFTPLDKVADLIGQIWKVETIGDCYKASSGGRSSARTTRSAEWSFRSPFSRSSPRFPNALTFPSAVDAAFTPDESLLRWLGLCCRAT